jgi:hypothetical protein
MVPLRPIATTNGFFVVSVERDLPQRPTTESVVRIVSPEVPVDRRIVVPPTEKTRQAFVVPRSK